MDEICEICGMRKATIVVKTNVNGVKSEQHLCAHCAAKLSAGENFVQDFFNEAAMLMSGMGGGYRTTARVCPKCGTTEREVRKNLRFGCSECYHTFADIVEQTYKQMRGKPYTGRTPLDTKVESAGEAAEKPKEKVKPVDEAAELSRQIDEAVKKRDFMLAAELQAKLDALKK